ncbi:hypothetical protein FSP39_018324 [Pinctada imbricata]|uniref:Coiled-coil domain-containing protein 86 n=1 Tax=Pinctada imbricata TaxID=66713 RepID=A0AA88XG81_PINIB|nr:hypothetical protein FSP39_018324 [Pinctada imbricata]
MLFFLFIFDRYSSMTTGKPLKTSWQEKMRKKAQAKSIKDFEKQLKDDRAKEKEAARLRAEEKKKRREENARKAEIVQTVKNPAKLKRMRKKQLRKTKKK